jgi:leucyl/phenylalanyl-tRNA--protein transferase
MRLKSQVRGGFGSVHAVPVEPPPSRWALPSPDAAADTEIAGVGADLAPGTLLAAYRQGLFPMRLRARGPLGLGPIGWWSPDPRGIIPLDGLHVSRSLRKSMRRFDVRVDTAFDEVVRGCADPHRPHGWIDKKFIAAYRELHDLGWAHSVETWLVNPDGDAGGDAELVGGLYGVCIGGLFAAESKFHRVRDASKAAVVALVDLLRGGGGALLDVQWTTPHLESLGAIDVPRAQYLELVADAIRRPQPSTFPDVGPR